MSSTANLRPLAFICVIAVTAIGGYRWGIAAALTVTALYTILAGPQYRSIESALLQNALLAGISLAFGMVLVEVVRGRSRSTQSALADLESTKKELERLKELQAAEAALRRVQQRLSAVGESLPFGTWEIGADGKQLVHVSDNYCRLLGMTRQQIEEGGWQDRVPAEDAARFLEAWNSRDQSEVFEGGYRVRAADGKTYSILSRGVRLTDTTGSTTGWAGFSLDITEHKRREAQLGILSDLGRVLSLSLEPFGTLERAAQLLVPRMADWCSIDLVTNATNGDEGTKRVLVLRRDPASERQNRPKLGERNDAWLFEQAAAHVIATHQPFNQDLSESEGEFRSIVSAPLIARGRTLGAITLATDGSGRTYTGDDADFASIIARRVALAFDNARLYERERRVADIFQRASLPSSLPTIPAIAIHAHYQPGASEAEIGGDWYDAFQLSDGRLGISIGDVAGKGLQAASIMSTVRLHIRASALEDLAPSLVLARVNQLLLIDKPIMVTAVFGIVDPEELTFTFSNAGHPLPIVASTEGDIVSSMPVAPPLGISPDAIFPEQALMLSLGSTLVLYTDGLVEGKRDKLLGEEALFAAIKSVAASSNENPAEAIASLMVGTLASDDVAVLTVSPALRPLLELDLTLPAQPVSSKLFRQALRRFYLAAGLSEAKIQVLQVATGEAITNSIQHAYGVRGGSVRVCGRVESGKLIVEIRDTGRWRGAHDDGGGYGLQVLKGIVQDVAIDSTEQGTTVRLTQPVGRVIT